MPGYSRPDSDDPPDEAPCARCGEVIDYDVTECPECGNRPISKAKWSCIGLMVGGFLISLTGIGAVIGIPMFLLGLVGRVGMGLDRVDYSPTEHDF